MKANPGDLMKWVGPSSIEVGKAKVAMVLEKATDYHTLVLIDGKPFIAHNSWLAPLQE